MNDEELPPLDADARHLLVGAARASANVPSGARLRVFERVGGIVGPAPGGPHGHAGRPPAFSPTTAVLFRRALPLVATFALGAGVGAAAMRALRPQGAPGTRVVYVDRVVPTLGQPSADGRAAPETTAPPASAPIATQGASALPHPSAAAGADVTAERRLLDVARHALDSGDATGALAAATDHERRYPNGALVQEREAMAIRALVMLGRSGEARARAARFRARFPNSVLLPAIDSWLGEATSP